MKSKGIWGTYQGVLTNEVVAKAGQVAGIDATSGKLVVGSGTLIDVFMRDLTGNDQLQAEVELFEPMHVRRFAPASTNAPVATDIGKSCYLTTDGRVSASSSDGVELGMVMAFQAGRVVVKVKGIN